MIKSEQVPAIKAQKALPPGRAFCEFSDKTVTKV